ncbi:MAG: hypothetical protein ACYTFG_21210 [Planctomycetota bacterium]|jgi:hypothetical protein
MDDAMADKLASLLEGAPQEYLEHLAGWLEELGVKLGEEGFSAHDLASAMAEIEGLVPSSPSGQGAILGEADLSAVADLFGTAEEASAGLPGAPGFPALGGEKGTAALDEAALKELTGEDFVPADPQDRLEIQEVLEELAELDKTGKEVVGELKTALGSVPVPLPEEIPGLLEELLEEQKPEPPGPPDAGPEPTPEELLVAMEALAVEVEGLLDKELKSLDATVPRETEREELSFSIPPDPEPELPPAPEGERPGEPIPEAPDTPDAPEEPEEPELDGASELEQISKVMDEVLGKLGEQLDALKIDKDVLGDLTV